MQRNHDTPKVAIITPVLRSRLPKMFERHHEIITALQEGSAYEVFFIANDKDKTIGAKRNELSEYAIELGADIIICCDDDDYYSYSYINICVEQLKTCDVTGLNKAYFYKPHTGCWLYDASHWGQPYVLGSGMAYWADVWQRNPFRDIMIGEDAEFCKNAGIIKPHNEIDHFLAILHDNNTSSKVLPRMMKQAPLETGKRILGDMYEMFNP